MPTRPTTFSYLLGLIDYKFVPTDTETDANKMQEERYDFQIFVYNF